MRTGLLERNMLAEIFPQLEKAFPEDELKPLGRMLASYDAGCYDCYGLWNEGALSGCAYFVRTGNDLMLDYFCVFEGLRMKGLGSGFLKLLSADFHKNDSVTAEVEDPAYAQDDESRKQMNRRIRFYLRAGFRDTGVSVRVFRVYYLLLEYADKPHSADDIRRIYSGHYRAMLPDDMYRANIEI